MRWRCAVNAKPINPELPTLAGELRKAGYTANMIGKWHLAPKEEAQGGGNGFVRPEFRAGFLDLWEGANEFEWTTHPYEGTIWDAGGKEIKFSGENRIEFITDRAVRFLEQKQEKPFLLYISQLEPHQQADGPGRVAVAVPQRGGRQGPAQQPLGPLPGGGGSAAARGVAQAPCGGEVAAELSGHRDAPLGVA